MVALNLDKLEEICKDMRADILRMTHAAGSGHPGGSLSAVELMAVLYFKVLNHRPQEPNWPERDRFILSKGHACPVLYTAMARSGYFPVEELLTLRKLGSRLQGHPNMKVLPGLETSSGSLGQGLSISNGLALAAKIDKLNYRVYCLMGDGELQEGQVWEAAMTAAHYKLDNVCAIVDYNNLQIDGKVEDVKGIAPLKDKWQAFNWHVIEINGHDLAEIEKAFAEAKEVQGKPSVILARTIKGKGVSFMEDVAGWHGKAPNQEELEKALEEIYGGRNLT
ncbi:MAG: transketolase [Clostridia bacterium]|nr:transketolase [Clostridia bacterium]